MQEWKYRSECASWRNDATCASRGHAADSSRIQVLTDRVGAVSCPCGSSDAQHAPESLLDAGDPLVAHVAGVFQQHHRL